MSIGRREQIENKLATELFKDEKKPWKKRKISNKQEKTLKRRRERRRAKNNPECPSEYRKYKGFEY